MFTVESNKALVRTLYEQVLLTGDTERIGEFFREDFVDHDPMRPGLSGHEVVRLLMTTLAGAIADRSLTMHDVVAEGDRVVVRFAIEGTQTGPFAGRPPSGERIALSVIAILRLEEGRIAERWGKVDVRFG